MIEEETKPSWGKRLLAVLVLAVAAWLLFKLVIGVVLAVATALAVVVAIIAVIWAIRVIA